MNFKSVRLLLVESDIQDVRIVRELLAETGDGKFQVEHVDHIPAALTRLGEERFDVVLVDMSRDRGVELDAIARLGEVSPRTAIVVLCDRFDESLSLKVVQAGAQDFLVKWQGDGFLLARSIRYAIEHKKEKDYLSRLACYDGLTGLTNRTLFRELLDKTVFQAGRKGESFALMFLDLDHFKEINDTLGHDMGDRLLVLVARRLQGCVRGCDVIARLGGDEFTIIQDAIEGHEDVEAVAKKIIHVMKQPFVIGDHVLNVGTSLGIAVFPEHGADALTLLKNADTSMYYAKEQGRQNYQFYAPEMRTRATRRLEMQRNLREALGRGEMSVCYQPRFRLQNREVIGVTACLRWQPQGEERLLTPEDFMPLAEETGMTVALGEWLIDKVCEQHRAWCDEGLPPMRITVSLSGRQLQQVALVDAIEQALKRYAMGARFFEVELNENSMHESMAAQDSVLDRLKDIGVSIAINNFGSGSFSLNCLKRLPIDTLKIDRSFVHNLSHSQDDAAITAAIITMARCMRMGVIAEGVEDAVQLEALLEQGCFMAQGDYLSPPLSSWELVRLLRKNTAFHAEKVALRQV
ncbi:MAG TPA: GGDEF domain-containing response regulator [Gammaproteobacteria bacterium]|nr:GGDEF domain-containing response regulator [Gammaproteobacteria bacterium]